MNIWIPQTSQTTGMSNQGYTRSYWVTAGREITTRTTPINAVTCLLITSAGRVLAERNSRLPTAEVKVQPQASQCGICGKLPLGPTQTSIQWAPGGLFPLKCSGCVVRVTTYLHLVLRLRMSGAIPPLPNMPSWHGQLYRYVMAQVKFRFNQFLIKLDIQPLAYRWR